MSETTDLAQVAPAAPDFSGWTCPAPLRDQERIVMGHGGGGALSAELVEHVFAPAFGGRVLSSLADSAAVELGGARLAFSTDSFVVRPLFFPGGSIGDLAVNGTVNDLAMSGARAAYLSCGFILEEGVEMAVVARVAEALGAAARTAGVEVATGDTKVVEAGRGDGIYLNTSGIGLIPQGVDIRPQRATPGDVVLVSGPIGEHGVAVLSVREGLEFGVGVKSDCAALGSLVEAMLAVTPDIHVLRDPTRGGLASALGEIAVAASVGVTLRERDIPVPPEVANACAILGLDPMYVANEGKLVAFVPPAHAEAVLAAMRAHPLGAGAAAIGECVKAHPGMVTVRTALGGTRVVDLPIGEQLPRIC
ncbi:hydrogenase expression/formation protein HypE [Streptomyces physcomitrii]|uniref:Hydrogenase expression/formation protein HypE n=1 Tax=Streptomyces physcomitrii TaxID=2724184 RepID=A0ABX1H417_9ACTN|nr:hydrogenase expression/formation protein HypE [Streptomyces physcomitrii]NKI42004.1 hydrogenase expression/formation protein HypE [Streptomyces physcomitrii]